MSDVKVLNVDAENEMLTFRIGNKGYMMGAELLGELLSEHLDGKWEKVVRCKDCKHYVKSEKCCALHSNNYYPPVIMEKDDFCSRGEKREDANN